jgi:hypothetical protein
MPIVTAYSFYKEKLLDISSLKTGIYLIRVVTEKGAVYNGRILKTD